MLLHRIVKWGVMILILFSLFHFQQSQQIKPCATLMWAQIPQFFNVASTIVTPLRMSHNNHWLCRCYIFVCSMIKSNLDYTEFVSFNFIVQSAVCLWNDVSSFGCDGKGKRIIWIIIFNHKWMRAMRCKAYDVIWQKCCLFDGKYWFHYVYVLRRSFSADACDEIERGKEKLKYYGNWDFFLSSRAETIIKI